MFVYWEVFINYYEELIKGNILQCCSYPNQYFFMKNNYIMWYDNKNGSTGFLKQNKVGEYIFVHDKFIPRTFPIKIKAVKCLLGDLYVL